ncbi:AAA family ATPase [Candidatus Micrarchaeota archaeon]|nr:AAA family ATPase [Candidatus Micrarchaeota archaeon]MBU1930858.1 AAA family ATPase [Candidatus Micrarchaeota archaeon]
MGRIKTYIKDLDTFIEGGIPEGHIVLITGTPGTGKSILCSQILHKNALEGKKCLYLNLEQDSGRLEHQMSVCGWDATKTKNLKIISLDADNSDLTNFLLTEIAKVKYDLICLDSLDSISTNPVNPMDLTMKFEGSMVPLAPENVNRLRLKSVFKALSKSKATVLLTSEKVENQVGLTRDTISEFLCDGIIALYYLGVGSSEFRSMQILKMRSSAHEKGFILFEIGKNGIVLKKKEDAFK